MDKDQERTFGSRDSFICAHIVRGIAAREDLTDAQKIELADFLRRRFDNAVAAWDTRQDEELLHNIRAIPGKPGALGDLARIPSSP